MNRSRRKQDEYTSITDRIDVSDRIDPIESPIYPTPLGVNFGNFHDSNEQEEMDILENDSGLVYRMPLNAGLGSMQTEDEENNDYDDDEENLDTEEGDEEEETHLTNEELLLLQSINMIPVKFTIYKNHLKLPILILNSYIFFTLFSNKNGEPTFLMESWINPGDEYFL